MKKISRVAMGALVLSMLHLTTIASASDERVVARVNNAVITMDQLMDPLIEGYGLNVLLNLVQLEVATQHMAAQNLVVSAEDIARERQETIDRMFRDSNADLLEKLERAIEQERHEEAERIRQQIDSDNERAFRQFLDNQNKSEVEFNLVVEINAHVRKLAEPLLKGMITEEHLREAFASLYGETVDCRHIQLANLQEVQEARNRLRAGQPFERVAMEMSRNETTAPLGGRLPPFSRQATGLPQAFKDAAFALRPGEISDIVQAEGSFHLIYLERRNPPRAVKFEDVRQSLTEDLHERALSAVMKQLRQEIGEQALAVMKIEQPVLKEQLESRLGRRESEIRDPDEISRQLERERVLRERQPQVPELSSTP